MTLEANGLRAARPQATLTQIRRMVKNSDGLNEADQRGCTSNRAALSFFHRPNGFPRLFARPYL